MKIRRLDYKVRNNASKLHKQIGEILRGEAPWNGYKVYQEYPVKRVNKDWKDGRAKFDWVILDLKVVIEVHGEQHFKPVTFGGIPQEEAVRDFRKRVLQDKLKKEAAEAAGFKYIMFRYDEKITSDLLYKRFK